MSEKGNMLHQLIAVEPDLAQQSRAILEETVNTFLKKADHFDGIQKIYTPFTEMEGVVTERIPPEIKEVVTTVAEKLDYSKNIVIKALNATLSKEETNASGKARAELVVDGISFGTFAATSFIAMERILERIREEYKAIPTTDPTRTWNREEASGRLLYQSTVEVKYRAVKTKTPIVLAPATDKHPAQVQLLDDDKQVGKYETTYLSGKIKPIEKSNLLEKIDNLIIAVKRAREQANQVEVTNVDLGKKIFEYIHS